MAHKRPLDAAVPEQEAAPSPRKRLRQAVFLVMRLERRARAVTVEQTVRQMQLGVAQLLVLVMVLFSRIGSMEERLLLELPNMLQGLVAEQLRSLMVPMEDMIRSVLRSEMQKPQAASLPNGVCDPSSSRAISEGPPETGGSSGVVKLRFVGADRPKDPLFTSCPVKWHNGQNAKVAIFRNEKQITGGDLSKLQIEILPVNADFFTESGQEDFTKEEFEKHIHMCKGKEVVLKTVNLRNGEADLGSIIFAESSHLKKLRLTAKVKRQDLTVRVQEAITDPFVVKDRRSESNEKSNIPSKGDAVHTLKRISQNGKRFTALQGKKITTVKHLMRQYHKDKSALQKLTGMKKEEWNTMIKHATMCDPGNEIYSYRVAEENCELLFNDFYDLVGMMSNGCYVPVSALGQFQQLNNWKTSGYKRLEERENSGDLIPDYLMRNDSPVRAMPLNNVAGSSVQARPAWRHPNDMSAQQEFREQHPVWQQNGFSPAEVRSNNDAGPSKQKAPLFSQYTAHQELGQHHPSMPQNETPYYPPQENNLNGQGSFSGQPTIPSHIFPPVPKDDLITAAGLIEQHNGHLSSSMTDAPGTSCPVTGVIATSQFFQFHYGLSQATSSFNHAADDIWIGLSTTELQEILQQVNLPDQGFLQDDDGELPNFSTQLDGYERDGVNP
ncbi:hypothetical protein ACQ4PT_061797 [Festuca glaucescens]